MVVMFLPARHQVLTYDGNLRENERALMLRPKIMRVNPSNVDSHALSATVR